MAVWLTALKLVPWGDVMEATPQILQAAKKLMGRTSAANKTPVAATLAGAGGALANPVVEQVRQLIERVGQLEQEQQDSAALIQSLAEQNAVVIRAVEALRVRNQRLGFAVVALGVLVAGGAIWVLLRT